MIFGHIPAVGDWKGYLSQSEMAVLLAACVLSFFLFLRSPSSLEKCQGTKHQKEQQSISSSGYSI